MRIKKVAPTTSIQAQVVNTRSNSTEDTYACDYINNSESYSTDEVMTNKRWLGKPIYRKVVNFGSLPNATSKNVSHNISNLENIINIKGWAKRTDGTTFPLPYESGTNISENIALFTNNTNISIYCGTDRTEFSTTYIILEYTKTTQQTRSMPTEEKTR